MFTSDEPSGSAAAADNANVDATNGEMSTDEFFRDHAQASPKGRVRAPRTATVNSFEPR